MQIRNKSFLASLNQKQNVQIDNPSSSGGHGKYMKHLSLPWPLLEATQSIFNVSFLLQSNYFEIKLIKTTRLPLMPNHKLLKNVNVDNIRSVVQ